MKPNAVIFDIDGTLADCRHRLHHIKKKPPDWDSFFAAVGDDTPHKDVTSLLKNLQEGSEILLVSGRPERTRAATELWLNLHLWPSRHRHLFMRPDDDRRPDHVVKEEILHRIRETWDVWLVVDDRPQVVEMWRRNGLTCLQCRDWEEPLPEKPGHLVLMVGPSGSGKSRWLTWNNLPCFTLDLAEVVSSDQLRRQLCGGNFQDQSRNDQVFAALHDIVATRLKHGLNAVVDATNIRRADRLACVALARGGPVHYVVVDRPMDEKLVDRGWRPPELIERHHQTFQSQLKDILAGDNLPNVTVHNFIR